MQHPPNSNIAIIDLDLGTRLAGNKPDLARELLLFLAKNIIHDVADIQSAYHNHDITLLKSLLHKLHGAVTYCGTPRLQAIMNQLNTALKVVPPNDSLNDLIAALTIAAEQFVQQAPLLTA